MDKKLEKSSLIFEHNGIATYSCYVKGKLSNEKWNKGIDLLKSAFPEIRQDEAFVETLKDRLIANGFSDEKFSHAVKNAIDTAKILRISDIISYDKTFKVKR